MLGRALILFLCLGLGLSLISATRGRTRVLLAALALLIGGYLLFRDPDVVFRSSDGRWADSEVKSEGRDFGVIVWNFEAYKIRCTAPRAMLMRATPQLWYDVFAWPSYLRDRAWRAPYSDAHSELGDYYPPAYVENNCYNRGSSQSEDNLAQSNAAAYLERLK